MVIAILAAITIVSFNGIQQSSKNTAIIDAASKSLRMIQAHVSSTNTYPYAVDSTFVCITTESTCRRNSPDVPGVAAFDTAMQATGSLPRSVPLASDTRAGITYHYVAARTVDGQSAPAILSYYLLGTNTPCGLPVITGENTAVSSSSNAFTQGNIGSSGLTQCVVSIPTPL